MILWTSACSASAPIARNEILVRARVVGGLQMVDGGEADDKIIAVLDNDYVYGVARDIKELPPIWWSACSTTSSPTSSYLTSPPPPGSSAFTGAPTR